MRRTVIDALLVTALTLGCATTAPTPAPSGGYELPKVVHRVKPEYPADLRQQRVTGSVVIAGTVPKEGGSLRDPHVVRSDDPRLEPYALAAVSHWIWAPGKKDGQPVDVTFQTTVSFSIP